MTFFFFTKNQKYSKEKKKMTVIKNSKKVRFERKKKAEVCQDAVSMATSHA